MALIKSISGFRGTIGGATADNLTPLNTTQFVVGFSRFIKENYDGKATIVVGRDGRISGKALLDIVKGTLCLCGVNVIDIDLTTTPTIEVAVPKLKAQGGIILTASHNPKEWNALKMVNHLGEFINAEEGAKVVQYAEDADILFPGVEDIGLVSEYATSMEDHIQLVLNDALVDKPAVEKHGFKVVVDGINSSGAIFIPEMLKALGVTEIITLNSEITGEFAHNPEPLAKHLKETCEAVVSNNADLGIVVDPDVDRLCFISENGEFFGEEYTLVAVADYILTHRKGNTVSNLSSTRALADVTAKHSGEYSPAKVGEVNVVTKMKEVNAVIGGEGNGGIIYPPLHYGRDALIGVALFLSHVAHKKQKLSEIRAELPAYFMVKNKIELTPDINVDAVLEGISSAFSEEKINKEDGVKIDFEKGWVHLRKSNTEPIIRVYAEATSIEEAERLVENVMSAVSVC